ncbi:hypothetical protein E2C01_092888 [Portunus trituberculatus]|uniref:Uncharacterized protein n=1 Tax=Portunus trituberculatus TaxID=210409 RepID=A0A5B7JX48_PORTR|nr:hypothetical protein [Portunus trituberculatus]
MSACGRYLAEVEEKAPPISPNNCCGSGLDTWHHDHEQTTSLRSSPTLHKAPFKNRLLDFTHLIRLIILSIFRLP